MTEYYAKTSAEVTKEELVHMELARDLAGECMVLLKNEGILPLREKGKLALYGNGARQTVKGGTGSGDVNSRSVVNIEDGLKQAGYEITTMGWLNRFTEKRENCIREHGELIREQAKKMGIPEFAVSFAHPFVEPGPVLITEEDVKESETDTAVYVIARNSGEGADRYCREGDYLLFPEEQENIRFLGEHYAKVVVVLNVGGVMSLTEISQMKGIGAILLMGQLGNIGGLALADTLSGAVTPSGKLTDTWAKDYTDYPSSAGFSHNDDNVDDEYYEDGIYVGYRYFDSFGVEPLYCFGYGKSYTDFEISVEHVSVEKAVATVNVSVKNVGDTYSGKEVVQIYVSAPTGKLEKPWQELTAFGKTKLLAPKESQTLAISFALTDLASYSEDEAAWMLEAGNYKIRVGNSSRNTVLAAEICLDGTVKTVECKNLFATEDLPQEIHPKQGAGENQENSPVPVITVAAKEIPTEKVTYQNCRQEYHTDKKEQLTAEDVKAGRCSVEELTAQLTVEELAELCVGTLRAEGGSVVGNASMTVPGAAGDSSAILKETRGIKNMILADGPAGLRLTPHFKTKKDGTLLPGGNMLGSSVEPFDESIPKEDTIDYYQYCTAIPIGWALAQSWNTELLEKAGDMVGEEMEEFHVDLWLAPALNIHRNPLCGRNFEYYSEDALISGKTAAAITRGVQRHPGKGTTIKHFAANNQEDNRYFTNSHISERALREIYLKGFEIAIRESQPMAVMTSYNLINGIHAANNYDLLQAAARDEWGFAGVVMTDWFTSQDMPMLTGGHKAIYPISASTGCIFAGNDLQMPGCRKNVTDLVTAVKEERELDGYKITLADLQFNAANVIRAAIKTMER